MKNLRVGYFGASTGAGAALVAAAKRPDAVGAVVSRGGRPDLAGEALSRVVAPTLLIVGGEDEPVIGMNREATEQIRAEKRLEVVPGRPTSLRSRENSKKSPGSPPDGLRATWAKERRADKYVERRQGHLRQDVSKVEDPRTLALFETTAEVLGGLITAYEHYEHGAEEAWRD